MIRETGYFLEVKKLATVNSSMWMLVSTTEKRRTNKHSFLGGLPGRVKSKYWFIILKFQLSSFFGVTIQILNLFLTKRFLFFFQKISKYYHHNISFLSASLWHFIPNKLHSSNGFFCFVFFQWHSRAIWTSRR